MSKARSKALGRGLEALIGDAEIESGAAGMETEKKGIEYIDINEIKPNHDQPRKVFNEEKITELSESIRLHGVIQPLIIRKAQKGYEIVAGERRWRAARAAGLREIPCIMRELTEEENMLFAIVENMQREDLNPIEEAEGLEKMIKTFGLTQEQVSGSVGKSRPYVANSLRLLKLPEEIRDMISSGDLSMGHGRAILSLNETKDQIELARRSVREGLSVREVEKVTEKPEKRKMKRRPARKSKDTDALQVEKELKDLLGTKVSINMSGSKGRIEIEYYSRDELERLIEMLRDLQIH